MHVGILRNLPEKGKELPQLLPHPGHCLSFHHFLSQARTFEGDREQIRKEQHCWCCHFFLHLVPPPRYLLSNVLLFLFSFLYDNGTVIYPPPQLPPSLAHPLWLPTYLLFPCCCFPLPSAATLTLTIMAKISKHCIIEPLWLYIACEKQTRLLLFKFGRVDYSKNPRTSYCGKMSPVCAWPNSLCFLIHTRATFRTGYKEVRNNVLNRGCPLSLVYFVHSHGKCVLFSSTDFVLIKELAHPLWLPIGT